ncbi:ATP-dependent RNA helicase DDX24 [Erpetoichthys calabaricus]|uniref:ATP-dependent RNA helicase n=1 Tax=Erpetoichthys calabaricus TaxID=27687 RepID=A0A8C4SSC7_ERPCA|nr:ATP-dependent RNA helicase DDX24 [Erpetoichthys calabaricus]
MKVKTLKKRFRSGFVNCEIQEKGHWAPVDLDPSILSEGGSGLVCFEELKDYRLVHSSKKVKKEVKRKRNVEEKLAVEKNDTDEEELVDSAHPPKKRKKKDKKAIDLCPPLGSDNKSKSDSSQVSKKKKKQQKKAAEPHTPATGQAQENKKMRAVSPPPRYPQSDMSAWKDLFVPEPVLLALSDLGFDSPTPIQALTLPSAIRDKRDVFGAAETGSGKTLAYGIPMIHSILEWKKLSEEKSAEEESFESQDDLKETCDQVSEAASDTTEEEGDDNQEEIEPDQLGCVKVVDNVVFDFEGKETTPKSKKPLLGLVLTPTRELAVQVKKHIDAATKFTGIKTAIVVGGMAPQKQKRVLNHKPDIVVATPGRLWELVKEKHPHLTNLRELRCLVIDEADRMVEKGHFAELSELLEVLRTFQFNPKRQHFVFSATLTLVHETPMRVLQKKGKQMDSDTKLGMLMKKVGIRTKPKIVDLTRKEATVETLTETALYCDTDEKDFYLYYFLLQHPGRTLVFANSIDCVKRLYTLLSILECSPLTLHANMHQKQRLKNLERFAERSSCVFLTTDVAARGLDIPDIDHVIHYQVPRTSETYVHRSGRTARAMKKGLTLLLIGPDDMLNFRKIYRTLGKDESLPQFPTEVKCMAAIKERVKLARDIEKIEYHTNREKQHDSWFKKAAEALEMELDDDILIGSKKGRDEYEDKQREKMLKGMKKTLKHFLSQPIFKHTMKTKYPTQSGKLVLPDLPLLKGHTALSTVAEHKSKKLELKKQKKQLTPKKKEKM